MSETTTNVGASFAELFEQSSLRLKEGEVVQGNVLAITDDHIQVDVGFKSEGLVASWEFMEEDGTLTIKVGDIVDVFVEQTEDEDGYIVLSKEKADRLKVWDAIENAYEADEAVEGRILSRRRCARLPTGARNRLVP